MLLRLCILQRESSKIEDAALSICYSFSTKDELNYVLFGLPFSEKKSVLIARNNNDDDGLHPNGVLFMDGYWFGLDPIECNAIKMELETQFLDLNASFMAEELASLVNADLLPKGLTLLT